MALNAHLQGTDESEHETMAHSQYIQFCTDINKRHNIVTLIKQVHHMISVVQLHRGMSMSLLGGNKLFQAEIKRLQGELEKRLAVIETFVASIDGLVSELDKRNLQQAWLTVRHDWEDDKLLDNFELHSHFIEQLVVMIGGLAQQLEQPLTHLTPPTYDEENNQSNTAYPTTFRLIELLNFISRQLPQMIEMLGKIRGLSSYAASIGQVEYIQDRKLRYLVQCAKEKNEKLRHQSKRLNTIWDGQLPSLGDIVTCEMKVLFLFSTVENDILSGKEIVMESHQLFKLATEIIDTYSKIVQNGWDLVRKQLDTDMENWIRSSASNHTS